MQQAFVFGCWRPPFLPIWFQLIWLAKETQTGHEVSEVATQNCGVGSCHAAGTVIQSLLPLLFLCPTSHKGLPTEANYLGAPLGDEWRIWLESASVRFSDLDDFLQPLINKFALYNLPEPLVVLLNLNQWGGVDLSLVFLHRHVVSVVVTFHALQRWMVKR